MTVRIAVALGFLVLLAPVVSAEDHQDEQDALLAKLLDAREIPAARTGAARQLQRTPPGADAVPQLAELLLELRPKSERIKREVVDLETNRIVATQQETQLLPLDVLQNTVGLGAEVAAILGKMGEDASPAVPEINDFLVDVLVQARAAARECREIQLKSNFYTNERLAQTARIALAVDAAAVKVVDALGEIGADAARGVPLLASILKKPIFPARSLLEFVAPLGAEVEWREYFLPESVADQPDAAAGDSDDLEDFRIAGASQGRRAQGGGPAARGESRLRDAAARALGKIGSRPAVEALHDVVAYGDDEQVLAPRRVQSLAYAALEKLSRDHPDDATRAEAAKAVKRLRPAP